MLTSLVMSIFIRQISGAPLPNSSCVLSAMPPPLSTLVDATGCAPSDQRSLWEIVWGCIVTIFSCIWIAIHPNIPGPDDSRWCVFKRGITTMVYALIAPELVMAWALRQHICARHIMRDYNEEILKIESPQMPFHRRVAKFIKQCFFRGEECNKPNDDRWTKTHGFFIQMGGFMLYKDGAPVEVLTYKRLKNLIKEEQVDIPRITKRTINDKSKSDYLSKGFVVLQTTWFVVQCIARLANFLPLAELEVLTLAFAVLNAITYAIWFDKPQNVQEGVRIDWKPTSPSDLHNLELEFQSPEQPHSTRSWLHRMLLKDYDHWRKTWSGLLWFIMCRIPYRVVESAGRLTAKLTASTNSDGGDYQRGLLQRVSMFRCENVERVSLAWKVYPPCVIGILYGLIHILAWNSGPTKFEEQLWRYSSLIITIHPAFVALVTYLGIIADKVDVLSDFFDNNGYLGYILLYLVVAGSFVYVIARVALIVEAFVSLRQLPPNTFCDVAWSSFIPHF